MLCVATTPCNLLVFCSVINANVCMLSVVMCAWLDCPAQSFLEVLEDGVRIPSLESAELVLRQHGGPRSFLYSPAGDKLLYCEIHVRKGRRLALLCLGFFSIELMPDDHSCDLIIHLCFTIRVLYISVSSCCV